PTRSILRRLGRVWRPLRGYDAREVHIPQERGPRRHAVRSESFQGPRPVAEQPIRVVSTSGQTADELRGGGVADRHEASRILPQRSRREVRDGHRHSRDTVSVFASSAASSVCHGRLAHFTRTGNSQTPESTASFPSEPSTGSPGRPVTILWNFSNIVWASTFDLPLTASVMSEADAFETAQPCPRNATSAILPSSRRR